MPARRDHGASIGDDELYEKVRDQGASKEKAARIANAAANTSRTAVGRKGGKAGSYDDWTVKDLRKRAGELDIDGRSKMNRKRLITRCATTEVPVLVFFGIAAIVGLFILGIVGLRLRAAARQPDVSDGDLCQLKKANRITSVAVVASLVGLAVIGLAYLVF